MAPTAPGNIFSGAAHPMSHPWKLVFRGGSQHGPPLKCLLVFLNDHRIIRKHTEDTVVALHLESIQGIGISQGTEV